MRFAMPAVRTQAGADSAPRKGTAHATSALSDSTLPLSAAWPHSATVPPLHEVLLSAESRFLPEAVSAPATAGQDEEIVLEPAAHPRLNYLLQVAAHERDDPDAVGCDHGLHGAGNGSANERVDTQLDQAKPLHCPRIDRKGLLGFADDTPRLDLHQEDLPGEIEDRSDSVVPDRKCRLHLLESLLRVAVSNGL
jgi:hypothetical protein